MSVNALLITLITQYFTYPSRANPMMAWSRTIIKKVHVHMELGTYIVLLFEAFAAAAAAFRPSRSWYPPTT